MSKNIVKSAGWLLLINSCVKVLGFVREMVIANGFGASALSDAYLAAYTLPYFLQTVMGYAFVSAVLPVMARYWREEGDNTLACRLGSTMINLVAAVMLGVALLSMVFSRQLVWLTAPELPTDTAALAGSLALVIFPSVFFMSLGMVLSGILNSRYRFVAASSAPGMASLTVVIAAACFARGNVYIVAWGTLAGFICYFLVTLADMPRTGFRYRFCWDVRHPAIRQVARDILPITLGLAINQIYIIINRIFGSGLAEGSISALNYASKLVNLPMGVFVGAIVTAAFPALAEQAGQVDLSRLRHTVRRSLTLILLVSIPAAVGLMLLDKPIITLLFQGGQFDALATDMTAYALLWMAPSLIFIAMNMLIIRVYFSLGDVKTPLLTGAASILVNVAVSLILTPVMDHGALGLANSCAALANAGLLWYLLERRGGFFSGAGLGRELLKMTAATAAMCVPVLLLLPWVRSAQGKSQLLLIIGAVVIIAVAVYAAALFLLGSQSIKELKRGFKLKEQ